MLRRPEDQRPGCHGLAQCSQVDCTGAQQQQRYGSNHTQVKLIKERPTYNPTLHLFNFDPSHTQPLQLYVFFKNINYVATCSKNFLLHIYIIPRCKKHDKILRERFELKFQLHQSKQIQLFCWLEKVFCRIKLVSLPDSGYNIQKTGFRSHRHTEQCKK